MTTRNEILRILADGQFRSGTKIGEHLGISRSAVAKAVDGLVRAGLDIHRVRGRGYRLVSAVQLLDRAAIIDELAGLPIARQDAIVVLEETDSTSRFLIEHPELLDTLGIVCVAERQTAGRGRRGRHWVATPYRNVMLSMAWRFEAGPSVVAGLSLAAGVAVAEAMRDFAGAQVELKWPNDVIWHGRKLAGLLIDVRGEAAGPCTVILGLGVNLAIDPADAAHIDQPWADLASVTGAALDRNRFVAVLVRALYDMFLRFERVGLSEFSDRWEEFHAYGGQRVTVNTPTGDFSGTALSADESGALLVLDDHGRTHQLLAGDVTLRLAK